MLLCLISWILLAGSAAIVGSAILAIMNGPVFRHSGDRIIASIWLGLLIFGASLLGLSIIHPLTPGIGFGLLAGWTAIAACSKPGRSVIASCRRLTPSFVAAIGLLAAIVALNATRSVQLVDTGLYHYQLVSWLADFGTIPGMALLHSRLGFSSSWFALAAPFDFGPFLGRISGLLDGLAILLGLIHFALAGSRILQRRADSKDWFLAAGYPLIFAVSFAWAFEVSLSPDVPVWILTLIIGWLMMFATPLVASPDANAGSDRSCILPLVLALGAMSLKLSAAPMVAVAGLYFLWNSKWRWSTRLLSGVAASLIVLPMFAANVTTSGCPLFPSSPFCLNLPWGFGKAAAQIVSGDIGDVARWGGPTPIGATKWGWLHSWIFQLDKLVLLPFCAACLLGFVVFKGWRKHKSSLWSLALAFAGMAFVFITAPNPRFALGYLAICPALFAAAAGPELSASIGFHSGVRQARAFAPAYLFIAMAGLMAVEAGAGELKIRRKTGGVQSAQATSEHGALQRLVRPPSLPHFPGDVVIIESRQVDRVTGLKFVDETANGIEYRRPLGSEQCWALSLPCLPSPLESDVYLRRPEDGLRSGFVRSSDALGKAAPTLDGKTNIE